MGFTLGTISITVDVGDGRGIATREIPVALQQGVTPWEVARAIEDTVALFGRLTVGSDMRTLAMGAEERFRKMHEETDHGLGPWLDLADHFEREERWRTRAGVIRNRRLPFMAGEVPWQ